MKKSTVFVLILAILSIIVILGYSVYKSLEDAVGRKTDDYNEVSNLNDNSGNNTSTNNNKIETSLENELLSIVPLYSEIDAYSKKTVTSSEVPEALLYMAYKNAKVNKLYNTQNRTLKNLCANKYGNSNRCIMFVSIENLEKYLQKYYNKTINDLNIDSIPFKDTSEILERLDDDYYAVLTNEITNEIVKLTVSTKTYNYEGNLIIEEKLLFTLSDNKGYHGLYKTSQPGDDTKIADIEILKSNPNFDEEVANIIKEYTKKASRYESSYIKQDGRYIWTKTSLK